MSTTFDEEEFTYWYYDARRDNMEKRRLERICKLPSLKQVLINWKGDEMRFITTMRRLGKDYYT